LPLGCKKTSEKNFLIYARILKGGLFFCLFLMLINDWKHISKCF